MADPNGIARYWVISEQQLLAALRRVADGESPDLVYAEIYVNADREQIESDDG